MRRLLAFATLAILAIPGASLPAQAAEYVKICDNTVDSFYLPGTDTCVNVNNGQTVTDSGVTGLTQTEQDALDAQQYARDAEEGTAMTFALPGTTVDPGKHFGASFHVGAFGGYTALGIGGALRLGDNVTLDGGFSVGTTFGQVGGRAGLNVSW